MRPDGTNQRRLTTNSTQDDLAAWSPDGTKLAFTSTRSGRQQIWVMKADGSDQHEVTFLSGLNFWPTWSPDGTRIAFRADQDGNPEIYSIRADGTDLRRLTNNRSIDTSPNWGPDGRIAFESNRGALGSYGIWVMNGDGSDPQRLTPDQFGGDQTDPYWSRDGKRILFEADRDFPAGNTELYAMNADGGNIVRLTDYPAVDDLPTWSPDGKQIAFARGPTQFRDEIYVMNADGSSDHEITLPKLVGVDIGTFPARPRSGGLFSVLYDVEQASGADLTSATVTCSATVGRKNLRVRLSTFVETIGRAACNWRLVPKSRGKFVRGRIAVHSPTGTITQAFAARIR